MTVFGKILVFVNLVFSLIVGALVIMVYIVRTNWAAEYTQLTKRHEVAQKATEVALQDKAKILADYDGLIKKAEADLKDAIAQIKAEQAKLEAETTKFNTEKLRGDKYEALVKGSQVEVERRQSDVVKMRDSLNSEIKKNNELVTTSNQLRDAATAAEIQAKALKERNEQVVAQLQDMARDVARLKSAAAGGAAATTTVRNGKNPPPENVEGRITVTDPSGLVKISIGSDAGLARNQTLEVFRLAPRPTYLGTIRILEVGATEAVAQPIGKLSAPLQPEDRVASRILGG
jgi:hypothetical protein